MNPALPPVLRQKRNFNAQYIQTGTPVDRVAFMAHALRPSRCQYTRHQQKKIDIVRQKFRRTGQDESCNESDSVTTRVPQTQRHYRNKRSQASTAHGNGASNSPSDQTERMSPATTTDSKHEKHYPVFQSARQTVVTGDSRTVELREIVAAQRLQHLAREIVGSPVVGNRLRVVAGSSDLGSTGTPLDNASPSVQAVEDKGAALAAGSIVSRSGETVGKFSTADACVAVLPFIRRPLQATKNGVEIDRSPVRSPASPRRPAWRKASHRHMIGQPKDPRHLADLMQSSSFM